MKIELKQQISSILNKQIDPIFFEVAKKIAPEVVDHKYMPWLLAHKMKVDSAEIILALPDENREADFTDFQVSEAFTKKLGYDKDYIEKQIEERYTSGDLWLNPTKGPDFITTRGYWGDMQNSKKWVKKNGPAYYIIMGIMFDEFIPLFEADIQMNINKGENGTTGIARIIPRYDSVKDCPDLLPAENYKEILKSRKIIAQLSCICRMRHPEYAQDGGVCLASNKIADMAIKMGQGDEIPWEEAFEYVQKAGKKTPHVHMNKHSTKLSEIGSILCNCNTDVCDVLRATGPMGGKHPTWEYYGKSRFRAVIDPEKCIDCGLCRKKRCMFDAISIRYNREIGDEKHCVNETLCVGCGCCVETCTTSAIKMKLVDPPEVLSGKRRDDNNTIVTDDDENHKEMLNLFEA